MWHQLIAHSLRVSAVKLQLVVGLNITLCLTLKARTGILSVSFAYSDYNVHFEYDAEDLCTVNIKKRWATHVPTCLLYTFHVFTSEKLLSFTHISE